jgi:hypothetical protein
MKKDHYIIAAIDYANNHPDGFTQEELYLGIEIPEDRRPILNHFFGQDTDVHAFFQTGFRNEKPLFHLSKKGLELYIGINSSKSAAESRDIAKTSLIVTGFIAVLIPLITLRIGRSELFATLSTNRNETIVLINENRQDSLCQHNQVIVNEIVEFISKITHQVQYEIGIPEECYDNRGGHGYSLKNPLFYKNFEAFRLNGGILAAKVSLLIVNKQDHPVFRAHDNYAKSIREFQENCIDKSDYSYEKYLTKRQNITIAGSALIHELSNLMLSCHQRIPSEMIVRPPHL